MLRIDAHTLLGVALMCVVPFFLSACGQQEHASGERIDDRTATPVLQVDTVTTLISDSGVVRYRISAPQWQIYDQATPSYWEFAHGILLEKFDPNLTVVASLRSQYAIYWDHDERWELTGQVVAHNEQGETFETEKLIWDQRSERVYSDAAITITREASVIQGIGFESNQTMTRYTITNPTGYFPVQE